MRRFASGRIERLVEVEHQRHVVGPISLRMPLTRPLVIGGIAIAALDS